MSDDTASWQGRVEFSAAGPAANTPGVVIVRGDQTEIDRATTILIDNLPEGSLPGPDDNQGGTPDDATAPASTSEERRHEVIQGQFDAVSAVALLREAGLTAQLDHVMFAGAYYGDPFSGNPFSGNPFSGNPFSGNPFSGNPFSGNPFSGNPFSGNPFSGNPFSGNPFSGNPAAGNPYAAVYGNPLLAGRSDANFSLTGRGRSLARPAPEPGWGQARPRPRRLNDPKDTRPVVAVLDVPMLIRGTIALLAPDAVPTRADDTSGTPWLLQQVSPVGLGPGGAPTGRTFGTLSLAPAIEDQDTDGVLDRVAGHGMFVAGRIAQIAPGCELQVHQAMTNIGDVAESTIIGILESLAGQVDIVNLSFGGYAIDDMTGLARAIRKIQSTPGPWMSGLRVPRHQKGAIVVAAAGNDGVAFPPYPACLPGVVSVAALGPDGPAPFSNWGPWVRACATGVDVVSTFFRDFTSKNPGDPSSGASTFKGGATWSGTSFAAPLVAGRLANLMQDRQVLPKEAVRQLLDAPGLARLPGMGTIVT